jgi:hypothetical protein
MTAPVYTPIATEADMKGSSLSYMVRSLTDPQIVQLMTRASRQVEARCQRRVTPFLITETHIAEGVSMFTGGVDDGLPLPLTGSLGLSRGRALGGSESVRDFWVSEFAPLWPELWSYTSMAVTLIPLWGGSQLAVNYLNPMGLWVPDVDTGMVRLPIGTYCPVGTKIQVTYGGGYTRGYPEDLIQATKLQAAKTLIVELEPQARPGMDTNDLENEIVSLLAPYAKI